MFFKVFVIVSILQAVSGKTRIDPLVNTDVGLIKGLQANDGDYSMFLGIPFGKVDKENPFITATPYPNFESTFEAFSDNIVCPQVEDFNNTIVGTPDCLVLNVYVPSLASSRNLLPVLVWIHGGGFKFGDGNRYLYDPVFLVKQNIIVVAINYRLGPYGFMCLDTPELPGNQGLKDQLLALRWINRHIEAFGGDVNRITISGESAGSVSVALHLHSNNEKLYNQAILQSATEKLPWELPSKTLPIDIAQHLGFSTDKIDDAVSYLSQIDSDMVIAAVSELNLNFRPCVEKEFDGVEGFITQHWDTIDLPTIKDMNILIGFNSDECFYRHISYQDEYYEYFNIRDSLALDFNVDADDFKGMEETVRHFYFGDERMSQAMKRNVIDFDSDFSFISPTYRSISKYLDYGAQNIYFYVFSYSGERNYFRDFANYTTATHSEELGYIFEFSYLKNKPMTPEDEIVVNRMSTMWANFVKFGNPTPETSDLLQIKWTPINNISQMTYLHIDSELSLGSRPFNQRATFWDLFYRTNERSVNVHNPSEA